MPKTYTADPARTAVAAGRDTVPAWPATAAVPIIVLALFLASATVVASDHALLAQASTTQSLDHFRSPATAVTFLRVTAGAWAVVLSALQALVLKLLARGLAPASQIRFSRSWLWVLAGQVPFIVAVFVTKVLGGPMGVFSLLGLRVGFGLVSVVLYCVLANRMGRVAAPRAVALAVVMALLNTALLVLGS